MFTSVSQVALNPSNVVSRVVSFLAFSAFCSLLESVRTLQQYFGFFVVSGFYVFAGRRSRPNNDVLFDIENDDVAGSDLTAVRLMLSSVTCS